MVHASCADQLASLGVSSSVASFVDADTPSDACTKAVCTSTLASCSGTDNLVLVMSDEFSGDNQRFGVEKDNPIWTAEEVTTWDVDDVRLVSAWAVRTCDSVWSPAPQP